MKSAVRAADPAAFAVAPRVLRRVLRNEFELRGFWNRAPHLHSVAVARGRLYHLVEPDELGVDDLNHLPERVLLVEIPEDSELAEMPPHALGTLMHRRLLHAKVHAAFDALRDAGRLGPADFRRRIHRFGQVEFDEAFAVLRQEHRLRPDPDAASAYVELAATWVELKRFEPHLLPVWFPSLYYGRVDEVLSEDIDAAALYESTRLREMPEPPPTSAVEAPAPATPTPDSRPGFWRRLVSRRLHASRLKAARFVSSRGNDVRAAVLWRKARPFARGDEIDRIDADVAEAVERLTQRLQSALRFDETDAAVWRQVIAGLVDNSTRGFWNVDARLLFDLQKVCLDHEREVSAVDLIGWIVTFGRRPVRRPLPNQREVLMSKHLHSASRRVPAVALPADLRDKLSKLLDEAAKSAERQLRERLRPIVAGVLEEVGLTPANVPERVAFRKLGEELIDNVVAHGFVTMGDLRDAISRNNLKLNDLSGPVEFVKGDRLLRADRQLADELDGVYRRGDFYLRWLQALSSAAFGTATGRFIVRFFAIPFGGAYILLEGISHVLASATSRLMDEEWRLIQFREATRQQQIMSAELVAVVGLTLLLLIHSRRLRAVVSKTCRALWRVVRGLLFDIPRWLLKHEWVRAILRHPLMTLFRRWFVQPVALTGLAWLFVPLVGLDRPGWWGTGGLFVAFWLVANSRLGRDLEEVTAQQIERTWHRIRVHVFVALFDFVMESFKQFLDFIEKLLYEVDEFLRFRSGESALSLGVKAVLGVVWGTVAFVVRFAVTLLIEPQVNPIKHFPVVTVSHKILLPFIPALTKVLQNFTDTITAATLAGTIITCIPGIFGFLVWEFRENWRLYGANRLTTLEPTIVGEHGESFVRLLKPGFHSGTVPKTYARHRRASRNVDPARRRQGDVAFSQRMHHIEGSIRRFIERELLALLEESDSLSGPPLKVGLVEVGLNRVKVGLLREGGPAARVQFLEQSGWLIADLAEPGWIEQLPPDERLRFETALDGLYRLAGVDLVREQVHKCLPLPRPPYDVADRGLIVWPGGGYDTEVVYPLEERPTIRPRPKHVAETWSLPRLAAAQLVFSETDVSWSEWVRLWGVNVEAVATRDDRTDAALPEAAG